MSDPRRPGDGDYPEHDREPRRRDPDDRPRDDRYRGDHARDDRYQDPPRDPYDRAPARPEPGYHDPRSQPGYGQPQPGPYGGPGYGAPPQPAPYGAPGYGAPPQPGAYPPPPYYPPRRRKSKAPLIVSLCAGFVYAMFFILYFTGTLDRMIGRVVHFPPAMQASWCWESNTATDSMNYRMSGSRLNFVDVRSGAATEGTTIARSVLADVYVMQGTKTGRLSRWKWVVENPNRLAETLIQGADGAPGDGTVVYYNKCG